MKSTDEFLAACERAKGGRAPSPAESGASNAVGATSAASTRTGRHRQQSYSRWRATGKHRRDNPASLRDRIPSSEAVTLGLSSLSTGAAAANQFLPGHAQTAVNVALAGGGAAAAFRTWRSTKKKG